MTGHRGERSLQVAEREAPVHGETFNLVEHRRMRRVGVAPVRASRTHDVDRRVLREHRPDLHRRRLRTQNEPIIHEERVLHSARRMPRRYPQGREVIVVGLDLGPLGDAIAQADEEVDDVVYDHLRRMQVAPLERDTRQRNVDSFSLQTLFLFTGRDLFGPGVEGGFDLPRGEVGGPADLLALLGSIGCLCSS